MNTEVQIAKLSNKGIEAVKKSLPAKNRLQYELGKSYLTIQRWLKSNSANLTTAHSLQIISEETGIPQQELLEQ